MSETQTPLIEPALSNQAIRHELDPAKVKLEIARKMASLILQRNWHEERAKQNCADYAASLEVGDNRWVRPPDTPEQIRRVYDEMCREDRTYYATVRVMELPQAGNRFILAYGPEPKLTGTGPFATYEEACNWFYNGGR